MTMKETVAITPTSHVIDMTLPLLVVVFTHGPVKLRKNRAAVKIEQQYNNC